MDGLASRVDLRMALAAILMVALTVGCSSSGQPNPGERTGTGTTAATSHGSPANPSPTPAMPVVWAREFCDAFKPWSVRLQIDAETALSRTSTDRAFRGAFADGAEATHTLAAKLKVSESIPFAPPGVANVTVAAETIASRLAQAVAVAQGTGGAGAHPDDRHSLALTLVASHYALMSALSPRPEVSGGYSIQSVLRAEPGCPGFLSATDSLRLAFTGAVDSTFGVTREARWIEDIDHLLRWLPQLHAARVFSNPALTIQQSLADLKKDVPKLTDVEIWLGLQKAATLLGDVHTGTHFRPGMLEVSTLPVTFGWFSDGLYITGATAKDRELVGKRVTRVGAFSAADALARLALYMPRENDWGIQATVGPFFRTSEILVAAGVSPAGPVRFEFADGTSTELVPRLEPAPPVSIDSRLPAAFRPVLGAYPVSEPDTGTVYTRIPSFQYAGPVEDAVAALRSHVEEHQPARLVIDFRGNGGGLFVVADDFVMAVAKLKSDRPDLSVTVLTDGGTVSAAIGATIALRENSGARQLGQGTGQPPGFYGGVGYFALPNSGLQVTFSAGLFPAPRKYSGGGLIPDVRVLTSGVDVFQGRDPVLDAALGR